MLSVGGKQVPRTQKGGSVDVDFFDMGQTKKSISLQQKLQKTSESKWKLKETCWKGYINQLWFVWWIRPTEFKHKIHLSCCEIMLFTRWFTNSSGPLPRMKSPYSVCSSPWYYRYDVPRHRRHQDTSSPTFPRPKCEPSGGPAWVGADGMRDAMRCPGWETQQSSSGVGGFFLTFTPWTTKCR